MMGVVMMVGVVMACIRCFVVCLVMSLFTVVTVMGVGVALTFLCNKTRQDNIRTVGHKHFAQVMK